MLVQCYHQSCKSEPNVILKPTDKRPRVEPSSVAPPPPSSTRDTTAEESVDPAAAATAVPPASTSNDSDIQRMLETVMTIQAAHG